MSAEQLIQEIVEAGLASPHNLMPGLMQAGHSEAEAARLARHLAAALLRQCYDRCVPKED